MIKCRSITQNKVDVPLEGVLIFYSYSVQVEDRRKPRQGKTVSEFGTEKDYKVKMLVNSCTRNLDSVRMS